MRPTTSHQRIHTAAPTSQKFFVGSSNKKAKLVILQIEGLQDESTRKLCEKSLLGVYISLNTISFGRKVSELVA